MKPQASKVLERVTEDEPRLKRILHDEAIQGSELDVRWIAKASGYSPMSIYPAFDEHRPNGLSWKILDAACLGSRKVAARVVGWLSSRWLPHVAPRSIGDVLQAAVEAEGASIESRAIELAAARDGQITPDEMREIEAAWAHEDDRKEAKRAQFRAMAAEGAKLAPFRKQVAG